MTNTTPFITAFDAALRAFSPACGCRPGECRLGNWAYCSERHRSGVAPNNRLVCIQPGDEASGFKSAQGSANSSRMLAIGECTGLTRGMIDRDRFFVSTELSYPSIDWLLLVSGALLYLWLLVEFFLWFATVNQSVAKESAREKAKPEETRH
jgi:hypothetical protein